MIEIEFCFNQKITKVQANVNTCFKSIMDEYVQKTEINNQSIFYIANGIKLNPEQTIINQMSNQNKKDKKMIVLVCLFNRTDSLSSNTIICNKSKEIICPKCKEICRIKFENYKIKLYDCINGHIIDNIKLTEFKNTQNVNASTIICNKCNIENKGNTPNNEFYICITCNENICPSCKIIHNKNHNIRKYEEINSLCKKHGEPFVKYCQDCRLNLCLLCGEEHNSLHNIISLKLLFPNIISIKKRLSEIRDIINKLKSNIKIIIEKLNGSNYLNQINELNELMDQMEIYYEINEDLLKIYEQSKNINYETIQNIKEVNNSNEILEKINIINNNKNLNEQISIIFNLYNCINLDKKQLENLPKSPNIEIIENKSPIKKKIDNKKNQMTIIYNIKKDTDELLLFSDIFFNNNKNNCYLLIDNQKYNLIKSFKINENHKKKDIFEIILIEKKTITNMSHMFAVFPSDRNCLKLLPDISEWDTKNVKNMSSMFHFCSSLESLPDLSKWETKNVKDMNNMFKFCHLLKTIPGISEWNTKNVKNMGHIFDNCSSLESLPDISKWDTKNVKYMYNMFYNCIKLQSLPDISKWNTKNVEYMSCMFSCCYKLQSLPDISEWNTKSVKDMSHMFNYCSTLKSLPDISKWNTKNIKNMSWMFSDCYGLKSLSDLYKWDLKNLKSNDGMFLNCKLENLPILLNKK